MGMEDGMKSLTMGEGNADDEFDDLIVRGNLEITITYSCHQCATAASALTGWDVKPATSNNGWRWGCLTCRKNWDRGTEMAVVVHCRLRDLSFSFFTRWPLDRAVEELWPEVHHKAIDLVVLRSTSMVVERVTSASSSSPPFLRAFLTAYLQAICKQYTREGGMVPSMRRACVRVCVRACACVSV